MAIAQTAAEQVGHPSLSRPPFYRFATWTMRGVFHGTTRTRLIGLERVPRSGPLVVVANHAQWVDPVMLGAFFPRPVIFMAKQELWRRKPIGWIVERFGAFPVRRGEADRNAIRAGLGILEAGGAIGIFPEGTRSRTGVLKEPHPGASLLALKSGAPVLPVGVIGTVPLSWVAWVGSRPRVDIVFGEPFTLGGESAEGRSRLTHGTDIIMRRIAELLPPWMRGAYGE